MKPTGPLMIEHRLIERMLALFADGQRRMSDTGTADHGFLGISLDFFRTYVDKFHHGKEENILFKELAAKPLSSEDRNMLNGLIEDHGRMRHAVERLTDIAAVQDGAASTAAIAEHMETLIKGYPAHIEKEDRHFFISGMNYLNADEQASMLEKMGEFDRNFTQQRYLAIVRELEEGRRK